MNGGVIIDGSSKEREDKSEASADWGIGLFARTMNEEMTSLHEVIKESEKTEQRICDVMESVVRQGEDLDKNQKERLVNQYLDSSNVKSAMKFDVLKTGLIVLGAVAVAGLVAYGISQSGEEGA